LGCCVLLLVLLEIMPRKPCPEASAVDWGCCALLLALAQILLRVACPEASSVDPGCCVPVACAVDLGCCVLLLVLQEIMLRVPCPRLLRDARLVATGPAEHSRAPTDYAETRDRTGTFRSSV